MKASILVVLALSTLQAFAADYPKGPEESLTPGDLCHKADEVRYPEHVKYCRRDVDVTEKEAVVDAYDRLGYRVGAIGRHQFKIDHYIPLCMGGSNEMANLWPQHLSISAITDPLEEATCDAMSRGKLRQAEAIEIIKDGKANLEKVPDLLRDLQTR